MICVAPFAGARVETLQQIQAHQKETVAPFAGARVETPAWKNSFPDADSRSLRGSAS